MAVYLLDDKVLLDGGKVATSTDCCCGGCECCPPFDYPISGTVTFDSGLVDVGGGYSRQFSGDLPFTGVTSWAGSGQYNGGSNTDCACTAEPDCDPFFNCPDNFGPYCPTDYCVPPEPDTPFYFCQNLPITVDLKCISTGDDPPQGWYIRVAYGSSLGCNDSLFLWLTDADLDNVIPGYEQIVEGCSAGPSGTYNISLEGFGGTPGTASIDVTIEVETGACCSSYGVCDDDVARADCPGTWFCGGSVCECPPLEFCEIVATGACCFFGTCYDDVIPEDCTFIGGTTFGTCTDCAHETC